MLNVRASLEEMKNQQNLQQKFALKCLQYQKSNIENEKNLLFFTYEELCENKNQVVNNIISFIPDLKNIKSEQKFKAHNFKTKGEMEITNLNFEKISKTY